MKSKRKLITALTFSMFFLISNLIPNTMGISSYALGTIDNTDNLDIPERNFLTHSSGKAISAWIHTNGKRVEVRVLLSTGDLVSSFYFNVMNEGITHKIGSISIAELDDDEVLIFAVGMSSTSPEYNKATVCRLNINSYTHTEYGLNSVTTNYGGQVSGACRLSNIIKYTNTFYCFLLLYTDGGVACHTTLKFVATTNTLTSPLKGNTVYDITASYIQNPIIVESSSTSFIICAAESTQKIMTTCIYDITGSTLTELGSAPINYKMNYNRYLDYISVGIEDYDVGENIYYYYYLVYSTSTNLGVYTPAFQTYYFRQIFNNTFTSGNLIGNSITGISVSPRTYQTANGNPWTVGAMKQNSLEEFYVWYPYYEDYIGESFVWSTHKLTLELGNFTDIDSIVSLISDIEDTSSILQYQTYNDLLYKEESSYYQFDIYPDDTGVIWYGVGALTDYFTMTKVYIPTDSPLIQNKIYTFTYTFRDNNILYSGGIVLIYIDDNLITSKVTDSSGQVIITLSFSTIGSHIIDVKLYKSMMESNANYEDETSYTVVTGAVSTEGENIQLIGTGLYNAALSIIPVATCLLLPATYGYKTAKTIGFLAGLTIGLSIAVGSGLLPFYYVYLFVLIIAIALIMILRGGNGGSQ